MTFKLTSLVASSKLATPAEYLRKKPLALSVTMLSLSTTALAGGAFLNSMNTVEKTTQAASVSAPVKSTGDYEVVTQAAQVAGDYEGVAAPEERKAVVKPVSLTGDYTDEDAVKTSPGDYDDSDITGNYGEPEVTPEAASKLDNEALIKAALALPAPTASKTGAPKAAPVASKATAAAKATATKAPVKPLPTPAEVANDSGDVDPSFSTPADPTVKQTIPSKENMLGWPTTTQRVTSVYGMRFHPVLRVNKFHTGTDFGARCGASTFSSGYGTVFFAGSTKGYGNRIVVKHNQNLYTTYNHLSEINVKVGQRVKKGELIGLVGTTGYSTGCHLHFEVIKDMHFQNPLNWLHGKPTGDQSLIPLKSLSSGGTVVKKPAYTSYPTKLSNAYSARKAKETAALKPAPSASSRPKTTSSSRPSTSAPKPSASRTPKASSTPTATTKSKLSSPSASPTLLPSYTPSLSTSSSPKSLSTASTLTARSLAPVEPTSSAQSSSSEAKSTVALSSTRRALATEPTASATSTGQ